MASKFMKVWSVAGLKKAVKASTLEELKRKGLAKLNFQCAHEVLTAYMEDGTEVDDDEIFEALPEGAIIYLCQENESPLQASIIELAPEVQAAVSQPEAENPVEMVPSTRTKKAWPREFEISINRFSSTLISNLNEGISALNWATRHELMSIIAEDISQFTLNPDMLQRKQVARSLLKKFPALEAKLNGSLDGWAQRIYDKMKDVRKTLHLPAAGFVRKSKGGPSKKMPIRGETNFCPEDIMKDSQYEAALSAMVTESSKPVGQQNRQLIAEGLQATFARRRKVVVESVLTLESLKEMFPSLFTPSGLAFEFQALQSIDADELIINFRPFSEKIIREAVKKKSKANPVARESKVKQKRLRALTSKEALISAYDLVKPCTSDQDVVAAFMLLPFLLSEDPNLVYKILPYDTSFDNVPADTTSPIIVFLGDPFLTKEVYICGEGSVLIQCESPVSGIRDLFCLFYVANVEYPPDAVCTFLFLQVYLLQIHHSRRLPVKLSNFVEKIQ